MAIKTIVVGVDLGESGHRAMQLAIPTAQATRATLWLVHASEVGLEHAWRDLPLGARSAAQALRERLKGRFQNSLQELESERQRCEDLGLSCQSSCEEGRPWETILRTAVSVNADLIAVGDPVGAIGLPERLLGSTAERVVRQAPCSVLVSCGRLRDDYTGARIAVGVDFSVHGIEAVRWARDVANGIDGEVALLYVVPHPITEIIMPREWQTVLEGLASAGRSRLDQLIVSEGLKPNTTVHVLDGPIGKTLCNATAELNADLLFVGCRGEGRLRGMMLGSASQYCLRYSPVPVLTVRP
ncbi:MAG: universal stress protein [Deltaproteobacteria bacterium]|nr:universal stress protein [Deltaproteobacteria bacterium]MBW1875753.1 universal stress protein [Deltaproteobacteria bacterium]MBW2212203.1 universal stress protein [Deltaproteobacteria bacterium]MBW2214223.1 universal stress protein [Deltaproteobacteria bacterium]MBW2380996.1 universal stress protein [Deltaproteobacteria bacterium]